MRADKPVCVLVPNTGIVLSLLLCVACSRNSDVEVVDERYLSPNGVLVQHRGQLLKGEKHGIWYKYWDGDLYTMTTWKHGVEHGVQLSWDLIDGTLLSDGFNEGGKPHGRGRLFTGGRDNRLVELQWWRRGKQDGIWCYWTDDGELSKVMEFRDGYFVRGDEQPRGPCPYMTFGEGQHHLDPEDRTYSRPYPKTGRQRRRIPLPQR